MATEQITIIIDDSNEDVIINVYGELTPQDIEDHEFNSVKFIESPVLADIDIREIFWDADNNTFAFKTADGGTIQINQEPHDYYTNLEGAQLVNGDIVSTCGASGNRTAICLTDATNDTKTLACFGMVTVTTINNNNVGRITKSGGKVRGLNTSAYNEGDTIFVDPANKGKWTATRPVAPNRAVQIGTVAVKHSVEGVIELNIQVLPKLIELADVDGTDTKFLDAEFIWKQGSDGVHKKVTRANAGIKDLHGVEAIGAVTFDNSTHVLSIASITYWYQGVKFTSVTPITCDVDDFETLTANTLYYFDFTDASGVLECTVNSWNLKTKVPVAIGIWNGSEMALGKEWHGHERNLDWHTNAHLTIGTRYLSGLALTNPTTVNDALLTITGGTIYDEDLANNITQQTVSRIFYQVSAGVYTWVNSSLPYAGTTGQPQYLDTDNYTLTNVGLSKFANMWVYASNDIDRPIYIIPSHVATDYNTVALARAEAPPSLTGLNISPELKLLYRFIYRGDGQFQESTDYRQTSSLPAGGTAATSAASVSFTPSGTISSTNVQSAIQELDEDVRLKKVVAIKVNGDGSTLSTGDGKFIFPIPSEFNGFRLTNAQAGVTTVSSSGLPSVQVRNVTDSVDMLSTAITIDANEFTSYTATTPSVVNVSNATVTTGELIAIDVDAAGTGAKGLTVMLTFEP